MLVSEHWKLNVDSKISTEIKEKTYGVLDNLILIGTGKFSLSLREYS